MPDVPDFWINLPFTCPKPRTRLPRFLTATIHSRNRPAPLPSLRSWPVLAFLYDTHKNDWVSTSFAFSAVETRPEIIRILAVEDFRMRLATSSPFMSGRPTARVIRAGSSARDALNAPAPVASECTSKPARVRIRHNNPRVSGSSSTTRQTPREFKSPQDHLNPLMLPPAPLNRTGKPGAPWVQWAATTNTSRFGERGRHRSCVLDVPGFKRRLG